MINRLEDLMRSKETNKKRLVVVACHDKDVIEATIMAENLGLIEAILIGDKEKTLNICVDNNLRSKGLNILDIKDHKDAAETGIKIINEGKADFIMKGILESSTLLSAVLNKEWGLRTNSLLSHIMLYEVDSYDKLIFLTDGGMNLEPNVDQKIDIINNAVKVVKSLGRDIVKVACLAAKEKIDPKMKATLDAKDIKNYYLKGNFEKGVILDGPMALDLAISKDAADKKNFKSEVAGDADILLVPNIEMGNGIGKSITYFAGGKSAGIVMGARVPIVLVSRADSMESKLYSIALGTIVSN